ncbi:hypothetical protein PG984_005040 [Apiospora sp. TS-2023a]
MLHLLLLLTAPVVAGCLARVIYNIYLHPLRGYPGPVLCRATFLAWMLIQCRGESTNYIHAQHKRYGPVVRIEPNLLSYSDGQAWRDIYGHKTAVKSTAVGNLPKPPYAVRTNPNGYADILNVPGDAGHRRMRKLMTHMFSAAALEGQQPLICGYVDKLIATLQARAGQPVDIGLWFACVLIFSFTSTVSPANLSILLAVQHLMSLVHLRAEHGACMADYEQHQPWVTNIFGSVKQSYLQRILNRFPWPFNRLAYHIMVDEKLSKARKDEFSFAADRAKERLARGITMEKYDFMSYMLKYNDEKGMSEGEIISNSSILIIAGGETSAVYLSGLIYHLLCKPQAMEKLTSIIRSSFKSEEEITFNALLEIEYLTAVIQEGGRTYAPIPSGLPRVATKGGSLIAGRHVPEGTVVYVHAMAANLSPANFANPNDFVPERWLKQPPAEYVDDNHEATQAFSLGPRGCIGKNLAMSELRLILARVLWNFNINMCEESRGWKESQKTYNVWDKKPLMVVLTPQAPWSNEK